MNRLLHMAAALALGAGCALPALAQDTGTTDATHGNTTSQGAASSPRASTTPAGINHTISASDTSSAAALATNTMGAGPADLDRPATGSDLDMGWLGLLGLAGLLGLRRRRDADHRRMDVRPGSTR